MSYLDSRVQRGDGAVSAGIEKRFTSAYRKRGKEQVLHGYSVQASRRD